MSRRPPSRMNEQVAREIDACLSFRATGMSCQAISMALGVKEIELSETTVRRRLEQGYGMIVVPSVEEARAREIDAHHRVLEGIAWKVREGDSKAIGNWLRTHEALAKLQGLYMPVQVEVAVAATTSVDAELAALAEKLGLNDRAAEPAP